MPRKVRTTLIKAGKKTKKCLETAAWQTCKCILWTACAPCICCAVLILPQRRRRRRDDDEVYEPPIPQMPAPRRRTLSIPSSEFQDDQCLLEQPQSAFMTRLPLEIRRMIYEHALGNTIIHASAYDGALRVRGCVFPGECQGADFTRVAQKDIGFALPLLRTCRLIYSEAVDYLYTSNTFTLSNSYQQVPTIDYLSYFMLPHRIARLRTLHIYWDLDTPPYHLLAPTPMRNDSESSPWHRSWCAIAKLTGLRDLHIMLTSVSDPNFFIHNPQHWKHFGLTLLKSIPKIKAESFVITLPSDACTARVRMKSRQCVLRLPGSYRRP